MSALRPDSNKNHDLGSSSVKWGTLHVGDVQAETLTASGNVEVQGNLTVTGTQTSLQVQTVEANDPLIKLARANSSDAIDIGFYGLSNDGSDKYHGLFRDADDGKFYLFKDLGTEPSATVPTLSASNKAVIVANVEGSITGDVTGNADSADAWSSSRTVSFSGGDVAGSFSIDGSADVSAVDLTIQSGSVTDAMLAGSISDGKLSSDYVQTSEVDDSSIEWDSVGGHLQVKASGITNTMLAGSIANDKLSNSSVSFGGVSVSLGASDATPAFDLQDATGYPSAQLVGDVADSQLAQDYVQITEVDNASLEWDSVDGHLQVRTGGISNAMLGGSIANDKLANSSINIGGVSISLGGSDASPAIDLQDAINYPTSSLVGTITNDQLAGSIANGKLVNSSTSFSDGTTSSAVSLGGQLTIQGTSNEVEVSNSAGVFSIGLPDTITADVSGNASTATALATARNFSIGSGPVQAAAVSFDGTGNVSLTTSIADDQITNAMLQNDKLVIGVDGVDYDRVLGSTLGFDKGGDLTLSYSASENKVIYSLPSNITASTSGNAATATALETARTFSIGAGPVQASGISFDGTGNVSLTSSIADDQITNAMIANPGLNIKIDGATAELVELGEALDFSAGTDLDVSYNTATNKVTFSLEAEIGSDTTGNAASATILETSRDIQLTGDVVGSASFNGSANASISTTIANGAVDNAMLANSSFTVSDTSSSEAISLGDTLYFGGTSSEVEVSYNSSLNKFTFGLPDSVTISTNLDVGSALSVGGNISATGNISAAGLTATGANITFADNLIEFGVNNTDLEDIGFYGQRGDGIGGTNGFAGFAFDESSDKFIAFTSTGEPTTTVGSYTAAAAEVGALEASSIDCAGTVAGELRAEGSAPTSASDTGTAGDIRYDSSYIYICVATNTWKRATITTW